MKKIGLSLLAVIAILVAAILFRTMTYGSSAEVNAVELPVAPAVDRAQASQHLSEAIKIKTITYTAGDPVAGAEGPWLELRDWLLKSYPLAHQTMNREVIPGGYSLLYTWEGSQPDLPPLLMMAHQDVVPVTQGTENDWQGAPFAGEIKDGYIYGRGAIDDKSSLVGLMEAAETLIASGFAPKRTVYFMFGHDEEVLGSGAKAGVALLKSRGIAPIMVVDEGFMIVDDSPLTGKRMGFIGVAEKGYMSVELIAKSEGGHSSTPPRESATVRLSRAIVALDENQMPSYLAEAPTSTLFQAAGKDMPFAQRLVMANLWLFSGIVNKKMGEIPAANAMMRTTTAPTMLSASPKENVLAQRAVAVVNFRIHPKDTSEDIIAHIKSVTAHIPGIQVGETLSMNEATPVSPSDNRSFAVLNAVAEQSGEGAPVAAALVLGGTDARYATEITNNVYRFMPAILSSADLTGFHGTNERLSTENMQRMAEGYATIILAMDAP